MNPLYGYELHEQMETFLQEKCTNTRFLDTYRINVIYGEADNANLTQIRTRVYLYLGLAET